MDKLKLIKDFLDYGGGELFSTLMNGAEGRLESLERLCELLKDYSDRCRFIDGRSAAYRFMIKRAQKNGWLGKGSPDLKEHRLSDDERGYIEKEVGEYIASGGKGRIILKKALLAAAAAAAIGLLIFASFKYFSSERYQKMTDSVLEEFAERREDSREPRVGGGKD